MKKKLTRWWNLFKTNWNTPPKGRYMSLKEIVSLSAGGIGVKFIVFCINNMIISIGNALIGNTIGIDPSAMYVIYIISVLSGFPLTALRAKIIDNTNSMKGKYRPYIISMGIPSVILGIGFIAMPYEQMSLTAKCVTVLLFNIGFQFFYNFMLDAYDSLLNVLSPNTIERTDVSAVKSVVENLSPSIANIFLPLVARLITGNNTLYDLKVYRVLYPPMLIIGFAISLLVYVNTKEKIVQPKSRVIQISFADAFKAVAKNKYFWIISLAGWLGFLESSFNTIIGWMYNYQAACSAGQYSLIVAISGNASFWPNLFAPALIRKYGKKKILLLTNILNIVFIATMLPVVKTQNFSTIWVLLFVVFVNQLLSALGHFMNPSLNADIRDYQQYISGERIDGMFAAVGLVGSVITLATSSVLPTIYEKAGLNKAVALSLGYDGSNVYDVLYNAEHFTHISSVLVIASIAGAVLNLIPFFFYDLTESRQRAMIAVLKIRALFEDYGNGTLSDELLNETFEIINDARLWEGIEVQPVTGTKAERSAIKAQNEKAEISAYVLNELNRFSTPKGIKELEAARRTVTCGLDGLIDYSAQSKQEIKAMPKSTPEEKEDRRAALSAYNEMKAAKRAIKKYYPDGLNEFNLSVFDKLFDADEKNENEINSIIEKIKSANESGDKATVRQLKAELTPLRRIRSQIKAEIKKATKQNSIYNRAAKPYIKAQKLIAQSENYSRYDDIYAKYMQISN